MAMDLLACGLEAGQAVMALARLSVAGQAAMVQAMGLGIVKSPAEIRKIIANSFLLEKYEPKDMRQWDEAYDRYLNIVQ